MDKRTKDMGQRTKVQKYNKIVFFLHISKKSSNFARYL